MLKVINIIFLSALFLLELSSPVHALEEAYWIWAGRKIENINPKSRLYIHQGTIERGNGKHKPRLLRQGHGLVRLKDHDIYLVYRIENLTFKDELVDLFKTDLVRWRSRGNLVSGIQLDFDSPSKKLNLYIDFIKDFKKELNPDLKLSITGLADWASSGDKNVLKELSLTTDEIIFQLYEGANEIPFVDQYLRSIKNLDVPFKLGLLENQRYIINNFQHNNNLKGIVIFK
jgi:hypothetical protein